jgi:hypothetical protein
MTILKKIFNRKSEVLMFLAGLCILASVLTVATTGSFIFWKITKFFYMIGVIFILLDR